LGSTSNTWDSRPFGKLRAGSRLSGGAKPRYFWDDEEATKTPANCARRDSRGRLSLHVTWLSAASLLQFCVFDFGFVEERDGGVGVFPVGENILIGDASFGCVALLLEDSGQLQLSDNEY